MAITTSMIKDLRERTGAGMMDCKRALTEADGNMDAAIEALRIKGAAAAEKKSGRIAAEGIIVAVSNDTAGVLVEVNSETDFSAKEDSFKSFANEVAQAVLTHSPLNVEELSHAGCDSAESVEVARQELITKIGENISVRRFALINTDGGIISTYLHGARIGVMVKLNGGDDVLGRDIAMHVAASNPLCISEDQMDPAIVQQEKDIFIAQARESGKPDDIIEKMIGGRMKKFLKENTLLGQPFVKNPDQTVAELLSAANASVEEIVRYEVGEGIEKKTDDFVAEVMAQANA